jgi:hypothetical protein
MRAGGFVSKKPKPTKPVIKPSKKLKPYQWRRYLHEPMDKKGRVPIVWDDIEEVELELEEVEDLFEDKKKVKLVEETTHKKKGMFV